MNRKIKFGNLNIFFLKFKPSITTSSSSVICDIFTLNLDSTESCNTGKINILGGKIRAKLKDYVTLLLNENVKKDSRHVC